MQEHLRSKNLANFYIKEIRDRYEGNGVLVDKDQNVYEGEFKNGQKCGMGKLQMANGDIYSGEFALGNPHGKVICYETMNTKFRGK